MCLTGIYVRVMLEFGGDTVVTDFRIYWQWISLLLAATQEEFRSKLETSVKTHTLTCCLLLQVAILALCYTRSQSNQSVNQKNSKHIYVAPCVIFDRPIFLELYPWHRL